MSTAIGPPGQSASAGRSLDRGRPGLGCAGGTIPRPSLLFAPHIAGRGSEREAPGRPGNRGGSMYTVDIDTGGTMTDGLVADGSELHAIKVDTTPHDYTV